MQFLKISILTTILLFTCMHQACRKFVEIDLPPDRVATPSVFTSDSVASTAIAGLYSQMMQLQLSIANGGLSVYGGLSADELITTTAHINYEPFQNNALNDRTDVVASNFWVPAYAHLYHINAMLEGLDKSTGVSASLKNQLTGELLFVRAFYYFNLVNLFGDAPLILNTDYTSNSKRPRIASSILYQQIIADLQHAQSILPAGYPTAGRVRPTVWAATALLARVYLYAEKYPEAATEATKVIDAGLFELVTNTHEVFYGNSLETIWALLPTNRNTAEGAVFVPSTPSIIPVLILRPSLINSFEAGDTRRNAWVGQNTIGDSTYYYPNKYKVRSNNIVTEYNMILRFAEMYLIRAEARAQQNILQESTDDLNEIRVRAGLSIKPITNKENLLTDIEQENRIEFIAEQGHRWFDLKRLRRANEILNPLKGGAWQASDTLFPIPFTELTLNPYLVQNPGY